MRFAATVAGQWQLRHCLVQSKLDRMLLGFGIFNH